MKNAFFSLLLLTFSFLTPLTAQWQGGVRGGFQMADLAVTGLDADFEEDSELAPSFHLGAFARHRLDDRLGLQVEPLYSRKGSQVTSGAPGIRPEPVRTNLHYLCLPVLLDVRLGVIHLEGGMELGYLLDVTQSPDPVFFDPDDVYDTDFDLGLAVGIRYYKDRLSLRYVHGLGNVSSITFTDVNGEPVDEGAWRNRVVTVTVGYSFIGHKS